MVETPTSGKAEEQSDSKAVSVDMDAKLDAILDSLKPLEEKVTLLSERLEQVENKTPQFTPIRREPTSRETLADTYAPPEQLMRRVMGQVQRDGDTRTGQQGRMDDPNYLKTIPPKSRPVFRSGDIVRINPEALKWGSDRYWRDILGERPGVGEVLARQYMTKTYEPKYTVHIPGITGVRGDGFRESELLPA